MWEVYLIVLTLFVCAGFFVAGALDTDKLPDKRMFEDRSSAIITFAVCGVIWPLLVTLLPFLFIFYLGVKYKVRKKKES